MFAKRFLSVMVVIVLIALGALAGSARSAQARAQLHVVASFNILGDVAQNVAGDAAEVETLIPIGANPHAFEPSARDVATLSDADLVLVVGINFEEGLLDVLKEAAGDSVVSVSDCVPVRPVTEVEQEHTSEGSEHEQIQGESGADCEEHHRTAAAVFERAFIDSGQTLGLVAEGVCETEACDPHVWPDPANVALWTLAVRDVLSARDPANAGIYAANAEAYLRDLSALDSDIQALIDTIPENRRFLVTNHLTFNYFAARYGLTTVGVIIRGGSTSSEPSARDVIALIDTIRQYDVPAIFTETTVSEGLADQIAQETGALIVALYTGSLSKADGPAATYLDYMRLNATQIAAALGGD